MKQLLLALLALGAVSSQARYLNDVDSSWTLEELQRPGIIIQSAHNKNITGIPNVGVSGLGKTVYTKITGLCVEGGMIKTKDAREVCVERDYQIDNDGEIDRDAPKVCVATDFAVLSAPIYGSKQVCATARDAEGRAWLRRNHGRDLNTDFPNCSVFKTINMKRKTSWTFNIVRKRGKGHRNYSSRYNGELLFKKKFSLPACY